MIWLRDAQYADLINRLVRIERGVNLVQHELGIVESREMKIMATLDDVLADVTAESSSLDGLSTLLTGLKTQLAAALAAGGGITPAQQSQIDAIFAAAEANKGKIADALAANTPAAAT